MEFHRRSKQLAAKRRAARRHLKAKQCLQFAMFLSVAVTYATCTVSWSIWTKERSFTWWDRIVRGSFTEDWLENFQTSKETILYLCQELRHAISRQDTHMRKALPSEMRVAITLWCRGTNDSYRTVGHLFGVSCSSVCLIVKEVCQAIVNKPIYLGFLKTTH